MVLVSRLPIHQEHYDKYILYVKVCLLETPIPFKKIESMILDNRDEYRYSKECFGNKIIESIVNRKIYNDKKKEVYLAVPVNSKKYVLTLTFSDESLYKEIRTEIYNNRDKIIVIAGRWKSADKSNEIVSEVYGKKQVMVIKTYE